MTDKLTEQIAMVLHSHQKASAYGSWASNCPACSCGWKGAAWKDHVAAAVVETLGLTRESVPLMPPQGSGRSYRYVTEWVRGE